MIANHLDDERTQSSVASDKRQHPRIVREFSHDERDQWDDFVRSAPNGHPMQGWSWGEYQSRSGFIAIRLAVVHGDQIVAAAQLLMLKAFGVSLAYVPRGPVCRVEDRISYELLLEALHWHARQHRALFLRVEPNEPPTSRVGPFLRNQGFRLASAYSRPTQPRVCLMVDLTDGPDAVMARMRKQTRNKIRSMSRRLHVRSASTEADLVAFHEIMQAVATRRDFEVKPLAYYQTLLEELGPRQEANLLLAELDGEVIAGNLVIAYGAEGIAYHGGASEAHRNIPAIQLLDWSAMEWCIERGCTRYDLGGVFEKEEFHSGNDLTAPLTEDDIPPEYLGLFQYKRRLGSETVRFTGAYDYPFSPSLYRVWTELVDRRGDDDGVAGWIRCRLVKMLQRLPGRNA